MSLVIRSRAPVRISFAGGGTDISPYTENYGGAVVSAAINRYAYSTFIARDDDKIILDSLDMGLRLEFNDISEIKLDGQLDLVKSVILYFKENHPHFFEEHGKGFEIYTSCEIPPRSGLGSSASMFASVIGIFNKLAKEYRIDNYDAAELAYHLEREKVKNPGGRQDQYISVFGGINHIEFKGNDFVKVNSFNLKRDYILELESNLLLLNIGQRQDSGDIIDEQIKNISANKGSLDALHETKELATIAKYALLRGDINSIGEILDAGWQAKKKFSGQITNQQIDYIYSELKKVGGIGGKVTGAGGGGHLIFYCFPGKKLYVLKKALELGLKEVSFVFDHEGLTAWHSLNYEKNNTILYSRERSSEGIVSRNAYRENRAIGK
ncbi:MAG: GHMP kinase [Candidatus Gracilibacteria bacterium]